MGKSFKDDFQKDLYPNKQFRNVKKTKSISTNESEVDDPITSLLIHFAVQIHEYNTGEDETLYFDEAKQAITTLIEKRENESYLSHFHYDDWDNGDDDILRVGDYIFCDHQRDFDGYETTFKGKIVQHHDNKLPMIIYNVDNNEPNDSGDYADLQDLYMGGWTFSRIAHLTLKDEVSDITSEEE